jgi:hypothetical protein
MDFQHSTLPVSLLIEDNSIIHRVSYPMRHEPRALAGDPQHPMELMGIDPFLGRAHEVNGR